MIAFAESIKKMMGWCPLLDDDLRQINANGSLFSNLSNINPVRASSGSVYQIQTPLDMFDLRKLAILLVLGVSAFILIFTNYLNGTVVSFFVIIAIYFSFIVSFFLFDQYKISIDSEKLLIEMPLLNSIKIPKNSIQSIRIIDNFTYQNSWINLFLMVFTILFGIFQIMHLHDRIMRSIPLEEIILNIANTTLLIFIFISSIHRNNRRSKHPKSIRIINENKKITLYPRNEFEFKSLKEDLVR